ncbi:MAG: sigma 54-interacting transcriptional regulator [Gammaproteobacteria bacterium]|nr:sigma 54-interacting transcriptional regulator [Gammaproteobacteria bacterium]
MPVPDPYRALFRRLPVLAALLDQDGRFIDVSDAWVARTGYGREDLRGRRPEDLATPDSARRICEEHRPHFRRTGRLDNALVEFLTADGAILELLVTSTVERDEVSGVPHSLSVFSEVSDRVRLERRYLDLYQSTPAMLHTIDPEGRLTEVSNHWLDRLGYTREEVIGRSILEFMTDASRRPLVGRLREIISEGDFQNVPRQMVTRNGEVRDVLLSSHTERDARHTVVRTLVASKDVTERNRAEARLKEAYGEIARLKEELERERDYLREEVSVAMNLGRIVGGSPALRAMLARIEAVADTPANVLIVGETGTGKELVAHAIHTRSSRASGPLVKVNCASIPSDLFESEFFGHVRGAFTGAHRDRVGRFQLADGGTIFLDEVGEIPLALQGKLLRVIQEREFERVGDDATRVVDVRVISATNKDLEKAVEAGEFREDLYYRLSVFPVQVPPLRRRADDVVQLAVHFLEQVCRDFGRSCPQLTQAQAEALQSYAWPGNIRELKNVIERAVILSSGDTLRLDLSLPEVQTGADSTRTDIPSSGVSPAAPFLTDNEMRARQRINLVAALKAAEWRVSGKGGAAELLGIRPSTLTDRMKTLKIRRPRRAEAEDEKHS